MKTKILWAVIPLFILCIGLNGQVDRGGSEPRKSASDLIKEIRKNPPRKDSAKEQWDDFLKRNLQEKGFSREYLNKSSKTELRDIIKHMNNARTALEKGIHKRWFNNEPQVQHIFHEPWFKEAVSRESMHFAEEIHKLRLWEIGLYAFKMAINHADAGKRVKLYANLGGANMEHVKFLAQLDKSDKQQ